MTIRNLSYALHTIRNHQRFLSKIDIHASCTCHSKRNRCWLWLGPIEYNGYGRFHVQIAPGKNWKISAHRYAYEYCYGPLPDGVLILHRPPCIHKHCVRHLYDGDYNQNYLDKVEMGWTTWQHRYPERIIRGPNHYYSQHPELLRGENSPAVKLFDKDIDEIRQLWTTGQWLQKELAIRFQVDASYVSRIVRKEVR